MNGNGSGKKPQKGNVHGETSRTYMLPEQYPAVSGIQRHEDNRGISREMNPDGQLPSPAANAQHALDREAGAHD